MEGLAREILPLASPIMDHAHNRFLQHFIEQDVIGHMEADLGDGPLDLGRLRVAIAFADLAGYTRLTEEVGDEEAVSVVERFVEQVERSLPDDARIIKTIGDEVMVVGSDAGALRRLGGRASRQDVDAAAAAAHRHPLRRDALPRRRLLRPRGQPGFARRGAGGRRRGARRRGRWSTRRGAGLDFERIGEVRLKGFAEPTELFLARPREALSRVDLAARASRATGLLAGRPRRCVVLLSGGRDSTCLLDLAVTLAGAAWSGRCTSTTACGARRPTATRSTARRCASGSAWRWRCGARGATDGGGNVQAWARDVRYAAAARARRARRRAGWPPATRSPTRSRRSCTGWPSRPGGARCWGWRPSSGRLVRPLLAAEVTREETAAWCVERGLAWREDASNDDRAYARARVREDLLPALRAVDARAERNVLRTAALLRDEAAVLDELVADVLAGRDRRAARRAGRAAAGAGAARAAPPGRGRHRGALPAGGDAPGRRPGPGRPARWTSATARVRSSADGMLTVGRTPCAPAGASVPGPMRDPRSARSSSSPTTSSRRSATSASRSRSTTRDRTCCWSASSRARSSSSPT